MHPNDTGGPGRHLSIAPDSEASDRPQSIHPEANHPAKLVFLSDRQLASCHGKKCHGTWASANDAARWQHRRCGRSFHPYFCSYCGGYHVGSSLKQRAG